eukprot:1015625-Lingulodinium_polyedra.AAC.1
MPANWITKTTRPQSKASVTALSKASTATVPSLSLWFPPPKKAALFHTARMIADRLCDHVQA